MKAPKPPNPYKTAQAAAEQNKQTALTQQRVNMVDQATPTGLLSYRQTGTWDDGTPRFEATTTLAAPEQAALDQQREYDRLTNDLSIGQTRRLQGVLDQPLDLSNEAVEGRLMELGRTRLDPRFAQARSALETQLANQGVTQGSEAWRNAMTQFGQQENDAYNQLLLEGRGQSVKEALQMRNQPINEITALMSGGQIGLPEFRSTPQAGVSGVDLAGLVSDNYAARSKNYQAMLGGLSALGGQALQAPFAGGWKRFGSGS